MGNKIKMFLSKLISYDIYVKNDLHDNLGENFSRDESFPQSVPCNYVNYWISGNEN